MAGRRSRCWRRSKRSLGYKFDPCDEGPIADDVYRDHVGVHRQKQDGLSYIGATVLNGRLNPEQLHALATLSGDVWRRASARDDRAEHRAGEHSECEDAARWWRRSSRWACRWSRRCSIAARWPAPERSSASWPLRRPRALRSGWSARWRSGCRSSTSRLRLHVTGCTNSCGQSWIADIGLEGKKIKKDGKMVDAFYFCVGGAVGEHAGIARQIGYRAAAEDCPEAIERLLRGYLDAAQRRARICARTSAARAMRICARSGG